MSRAALFGAGRMARRIIDASRTGRGIEVVAVVSRHDPHWDEGPPWFPELPAAGVPFDIVIDFSLPGGTARAARWCGENRKPLLSGTTGLGDDDRRALDAASERAAVLWAPNYSTGLNLCLEATARAARVLPADTPVEILDVHHVHKKDAPSGTALWLAEAVAAARGQSPDEVLDLGGSAGEGEPPVSGIRCVSRREGEVAGYHRVRFRARGETLEFIHDARDRGIFARGALEAAAWLVDQKPGMYSVRNWLFGNALR